MAKNPQAATPRYLVVMPQIPHSSPLVTTLLRVLSVSAKIGFLLVPSLLTSDELGLDFMAVT